ncbi:MAG: LCP family protein [Anaerolineae bacterium]|nr:LCP family protein [Anaerolineae bacterium]
MKPVRPLTIFPGAEATPTSPPFVPDQVVRPILPTVPPDRLPTLTPQRGEPPTPIPSAIEVPRSLRNTENLLVLGSDQRKPGQPWRTDVIMVVAIDRAQRRVGIISIPRDLWVKIPGVGWERINTADFYGSLRKKKNDNPPNGIELLKETLRQNLGIPIHHYVRVDFEGFKGAVDALGGITVTVDCPLRDPGWDTPGKRWQLEPGNYFMTGEDALRYVRSRYTGGDLDRARRQQRVLLAMRDRALEINLWPRLPALYREFRDRVLTDLGPLDILDLARFGLSLRAEDIHGLVIGRPMVRDWITRSGAMVLVPDYRQIREAIEGLFDLPPLSETNDLSQQCP